MNLQAIRDVGERERVRQKGFGFAEVWSSRDLQVETRGQGQADATCCWLQLRSSLGNAEFFSQAFSVTVLAVCRRLH